MSSSSQQPPSQWAQFLADRDQEMNRPTDDFHVLNIAPVPAPVAVPPYGNNGLFDGYDNDNDVTVDDEDAEEQAAPPPPAPVAKPAKKAAEPESKSVHVIAAHRRIASATVTVPVPVMPAVQDADEEEEPAAPAPAVQKKKQAAPKEENSDDEDEDGKPVATVAATKKKPTPVVESEIKIKQLAKMPPGTVRKSDPLPAPAAAPAPVPAPVQPPAAEKPKPKPKEPAMATQPTKPQTEEPAAKRTKMTIEPEAIEALVDERVQAAEKRIKLSVEPDVIEAMVANRVRQEIRALLAQMAVTFDGKIPLPAEQPAKKVEPSATSDKKTSGNAITGTKRPVEPAAPAAPVAEPAGKTEKKVTPEVSGPVISAFETNDEWIEDAIRLMTEKVDEYLAKGTLKQVIEQTGRKLTGFLLNNGHLKDENDKDSEKYSKLAMSRWRAVCEFMHRMYPDEIAAFEPKRGLSRVEIAMKYCKEHTIGTKRTRVIAVVTDEYSQSVDYLAAGVAHIVASARERALAGKKVEQQQQPQEGEDEDN
jgi:hypothetical protein